MKDYVVWANAVVVQEPTARGYFAESAGGMGRDAGVAVLASPVAGGEAEHLM